MFVWEGEEGWGLRFVVRVCVCVCTKSMPEAEIEKVSECVSERERESGRE